MMSYEVQLRKKPFSNVPNLNDIKLAQILHDDDEDDDDNGEKISPKDELVMVPVPVREIISDCLSRDRSKRKSAAEFFAVLDQSYRIISNGYYDIFFSHAWVTKPILSHVKLLLAKRGYRVWYDMNDWGYDLSASMRNGVNKSTIFLACINENYQKSENCGFELEAALSNGKPVVVLCNQSDPFVWSTEPLKSRCKLPTNMFVDIG